MTRTLSLSCTLAAAGFGWWAPTAMAVVDVPDNFVHETIVSGLDQPLSMAFLPDGRLLFVEQRNGRVRMVVNGHIASTNPLLTVPNLNAEAFERGLQGIAVDPQWPSRPYLYLFLTRSGDRMRLVRYTASGPVNDPNAESLTLGTPLILIDDIPDNATNHNGGTLRFGPDGHLYASIGDDADMCAAQDSTQLQGNILRLRVTNLPAGGGGPVPRALLIPSPPTLASPDSNAKLVYAYGLRNPWRFHIDPVTGYIYQADVGDGTWEELSEVHAGDNLGWPFREGSAVRTAGGCTEPGGQGTRGYDPPIVSMNHSIGAKAILSAGVYRPASGGGANWPPTYHGSVFYTDYFMGVLRRLVKSGSTWVTPAAVPGQPSSSNWATGITAPVDFLVGPDGSLYCLSQFDASEEGTTGSLSRIRYTGSLADAPETRNGTLAFTGSPNPFVSTTTLSFTLTQAGPTRLMAFDARGRKVRGLIDGMVAAGHRQVVWNGDDDAGTSLPPGIYYLRLEHGGSTATFRVLRLR